MGRRVIIGAFFAAIFFVFIAHADFIKSFSWASDPVKPKSFPIQSYRLGMPIDGVKGMVELSTEEYKIFPKTFQDEKIYKTPNVLFLGFSWDMMIGAVGKKIYKMNPGIVTKNEKLANEVSIKTLEYCKSKLGDPVDEKIGRVIWDTEDGNVILQTGETEEGFAIFLFIASREAKNYKTLN